MRSLARIRNYLSNTEGVPVATSLPDDVVLDSDQYGEDCLVALVDASFSWDGATVEGDETPARGEDYPCSGVQMNTVTHQTAPEGGPHSPCTGNVLRHVSLVINKGDLVGVVGPVGAGKTSLLAGILGQLNCTSGHQMLNADVAYVGQEHWIQVEYHTHCKHNSHRQCRCR